MTRRIITSFFRFCLRVFFRRIEVVGRERVPRDHAVLFAVNHPNGLVDPLLLLCFAPADVAFLGKAPLFHMPFIGWFVRAFDSIPVYRKQDATAGSNAETFRLARELLQRGGSIAIFPEGTTHDEPKLRSLKTGAARIALGASVEELRIVPAGIYYTAKHSFRSSVLIVFGEPLPVRTVAVDAAGEPPAGDVDALTERIDAALDDVTLQADSQAALELVALAEDIFSADEEQPLAEELGLRRRFVDGYHYLALHDPARLERLRSKVAQLDRELKLARLDVHELRSRVAWLRLLRLLLLLPFALAGMLFNYATYRLVGAMARHFARGESHMVATMKFLAALALFPLTYLLLALAAGWRWGTAAALLAGVALPLTGYVALRVLEDLDDVIGDVRAAVHSVFRRYGHARLIAQQEEIRGEMLRVASEMDDVAAVRA